MSVETYVRFSEKIAGSIETNAPHADVCLEHLKPSLIWTNKNLELSQSLSSDVLLRGAYGAAVEAVSLIAVGLVRPAILSLRSHYELVFQHLYYKDHPVEWRNVLSYRSQPNLPGVNKKYLRDNYPNFEMRLKKLSAVKTRQNDDCYDVLSGVAHGAAINSISSATTPEDLVEVEGVVTQSIGVFHDAGEFLSDIHVACFESNWVSLPVSVQGSLSQRFTGKSPVKELDL